MSGTACTVSMTAAVGTVILTMAGIGHLRKKQQENRRHVDRIATDYTLLYQGIDASNGGDGGGYSRPVLVPKDPQAYAKAMAPRK